MRDFKRHVKGLILESNTSIDLVQDNDNGALFHYQNKINTFLNNTIKEVVSIVRDTNANLLTKISQGKIVNGDMVFNTTENTYQQVIAGQLVSFGSGGGGADPELEGRVDDLEEDVQAIATNQVEIEDNLAIARAELYDLINLTGVAENSSTLGPFTGVYLNDSSTIKEALQALEAAIEVGLDQTNIVGADLTTFINQVADLEDSLATESTNRINGDATTLAAAKAYTDVEIADLVAQAPITSDTLGELSGRIDTLQTTVSGLSGTDTTLTNQINTINNTTIPNAISTANDYTNTQIAALPPILPLTDFYAAAGGLLYIETFESTIKGTISGGAVLKDISTDPLNVLFGNKSLYFTHSSVSETFVSNPINVPVAGRSMALSFSCLVDTNVSTEQDNPETLSAVLRVYDITNQQYLQLNRKLTNNTYHPLRISIADLPADVNQSAAFSISHVSGCAVYMLGTTEQVRIEITSNVVQPSGFTIIDNISLRHYNV